jgi:hypothetical protein
LANPQADTVDGSQLTQPFAPPAAQPERHMYLIDLKQVRHA